MEIVLRSSDIHREVGAIRKAKLVHFGAISAPGFIAKESVGPLRGRIRPEVGPPKLNTHPYIDFMFSRMFDRFGP